MTTEILDSPLRETTRTAGEIGAEAASNYLNSHPPLDTSDHESFIQHHPERSVILALTTGLFLGWLMTDAFPRQVSHP